jgi:hypothetical protein
MWWHRSTEIIAYQALISGDFPALQPVAACKSLAICCESRPLLVALQQLVQYHDHHSGLAL